MTDNPPRRIHLNKLENIITFRIKTGYYLELVMTETMKLLESTKNKINKDKCIENMSHLEIIEVVAVHCSIINNDCQDDSEFRIRLFLTTRLVDYSIFYLNRRVKYDLLIKVLNC